MSLVIVGASLAGLRAARAARDAGYQGRIRLVGEEQAAPYERPPLSKKVLTEPLEVASLSLEPAGFYASHGIELELGVRAVSLASRHVLLADGSRMEFDELVIATGAAPRRLSVPGEQLDGICTLRTAGDAVELRQRLGEARHVVVVGAGLLGLEIAAAARAGGRSVVVLDRADHPLARLCHPAVGARVADRLAGHGVELRFGCESLVFQGRTRVESVTIAGGARIPADLVVVAIGVAPSTAWLAGSGVALGDGVLVDECARTSVPGVFAAGDVTSTWHPRLARRVRLERNGHASAQGRVAGRGAAGLVETYEPALFAGASVFGDRFQFAGLPEQEDELVLRGAPDSGAYVAFGLRDGAVRSAFAQNRPGDMSAIREWIEPGPRLPRSLLADPTTDLQAIRETALQGA